MVAVAFMVIVVNTHVTLTHYYEDTQRLLHLPLEYRRVGHSKLHICCLHGPGQGHGRVAFMVMFTFVAAHSDALL